MEQSLPEQLRDAGIELREEHDRDVIAETIAEVEQLESAHSDKTADLLRFMTGVAE